MPGRRVEASPQDRGNGLLNVGGGQNWYMLDVSTDINNIASVLNQCDIAYDAGSTVPRGYRCTGGAYWAWGTPAMTMFQTVVPPNSSQYAWNSCRQDCPGCGVDSSHIVNATSNHPGGCNVLFCDGSVKFIKSTLAIRTWWALGTIAGNEVLKRRPASSCAG